MDMEETVPREGYRMFVEPMIGLLELFMTGVSAIVVIEIVRTGHGPAVMRHLPALIKAVMLAH